jgi:hypothetical protein
MAVLTIGHDLCLKRVGDLDAATSLLADEDAEDTWQHPGASRLTARASEMVGNVDHH